MRRAAILAAALVVSVSTLTGCGDDASDPAPDAAPDAAPGASALAPGAATDAGIDRLLAAYGLDDLPADEVVATLDRLPLDERPDGLMASVRDDELLLSEGDEELPLPLPADRFYLSVAPYVDDTHDCFFHSLTTCQGELGGEEVTVTITTDDGEVLVEETTDVYDNGFVGFWLPDDVSGTVTVESDGLTGTEPFATGAEDPTCLTTLRLA